MAGSGRVVQARTRWWLPAALGLVLCATALNLPSASARPASRSVTSVAVAPALTPDEAGFLSAINSLRASQGLSQLAVSEELNGIAAGWNAQMVGAGQISHNPSLGSQVTSSWLKLGENVGVGTGIEGLMHAFIESPSHYQNLIDPEWTHIGIAVTWANGQMWTTHNFQQAGEQPPVVTAPPTTAAPVTVPPTTLPPETTTTTTPPVTAPPITATPVTVPPTTEAQDEPDVDDEAAPVDPPSPPPVDPSPERVTAVLVPLRSLGS